MSNLLLWLFIFIVSLAILIKAADFFTDAAEKIGLSLGLNQFIVGVTIVSLGTSLPELVSSMFAVYQNSSEIVSGNVIGSNIANILLIIGVTSILTKRIVIDYNLNDIDIPFFVGSAFLLTLTLINGDFSRGEAIICVMAYLVYFAYIVFETNDDDENFTDDFTLQNRRRKRSLWLPIAILVFSSIGIFIGANYTINSVVKLAEIIDINTEVIAVSAVAIGTSLPELVVSVTAAKKGNSGLVVGNILGSNIFNALMVMGIPGLFGKLDIVPEVVSRDLPVMLVATILFFFATQDKQITRWEGFLFFVLYGWFIGNLFNWL